MHRESIDFEHRLDAVALRQGRRRGLHQLPAERGAVRAFVAALLAGEKTDFKEWEKSTPYFEGCLPIEVMAARGVETLRFGPMKPVGLRDPRTGARPYAVVQLRQDNALGTLWNMVGFQTKLKHGEQVRIFRMIPGLENASFARLGGLHRNTFINSPRLLDAQLAAEGAARACASPDRSPASKAMSKAPPSACWPAASRRPNCWRRARAAADHRARRAARAHHRRRRCARPSSR